jgi:hypothetical protein
MWVIDWGKPCNLNDLDDVRDTVSLEEIIVVDGSQGTEPEMTEMVSRRREENLVHWRAHSLGVFRWDVVEPNHPLPDTPLLHVLSSRCLTPFPFPPPILINNLRSSSSRGLDPSPVSSDHSSLFWKHA